MTKPHHLPNKSGILPNSNVININEISTYGQAYDYHGQLAVKLSMVITS